VCQLSSDDWWESYKLEDQVKILDSDEKIGLVYSDFRYVFFEKEDIRDVMYRDCFYSDSRPLMFLKMFDGCYMNACTFLMRREFFFDVGYFSMLDHHEWNQDYRFNFLALSKTHWKIIKSNKTTAFISRHNLQASQRGKLGLGNDKLIPEMIKLGKSKGLL
jgi:hypothetical protein